MRSAPVAFRRATLPAPPVGKHLLRVMPKPAVRSSRLPAASSAYARFVVELKVRIGAARLSAARSVNRELILLYWDIGRGIVEKQAAEGWGESVVEHLAADLSEAFPGMRGFSVSNLWRMRQLFAALTAPDFLAQLARELAPKTKKPEILAQAVRELGGARLATAKQLTAVVREILPARSG